MTTSAEQAQAQQPPAAQTGPLDPLDKIIYAMLQREGELAATLKDIESRRDKALERLENKRDEKFKDLQRENLDHLDFRAYIADQKTRIGVCDGSSAAQVRAWIEEIELSLPILKRAPPSLLEVITSTVVGPFRKELERFIEAYREHNKVHRHEVPWEHIKRHMRDSFLAINEEEQLRNEMETLKQTPYESVASYNRRFRDAAESAYPTATRNEDQYRVIFKAYARGLRDSDIARKLIEAGAQHTLEDALSQTEGYASAKDRYQRLGRVEEPMEVGNVKEEPKSETQEKLVTLLEALGKRLERMSTRIAKVEANQDRPRQSREQRRPRESSLPPRRSAITARRDPTPPPRFRDRRTGEPPVCYNCNKRGHVAKNCRQLSQATEVNQPLN